MTQEEKARAYDEAIEKIKYVMEHGVSPVLNKEDLQDIFPELAESENERIRNEITELVMQPTWKTEKEFHRRKELCAWLEKQGEHKSIDDLTQQEAMDIAVAKCFEQGEKKPLLYKPKFNVGDKLVSTKNPHLTYEILNVGNVNELGNLEYEIEIFTDGDGKPGIQVGDTYKEHNIHLMECVKVDEWAKLIDEAKPKWTGEDDYNVQCCIAKIERDITNGYQGRNKELIDWLKSLKQRIEGKV